MNTLVVCAKVMFEYVYYIILHIPFNVLSDYITIRISIYIYTFQKPQL